MILPVMLLRFLGLSLSPLLPPNAIRWSSARCDAMMMNNWHWSARSTTERSHAHKYGCPMPRQAPCSRFPSTIDHRPSTIYNIPSCISPSFSIAIWGHPPSLLGCWLSVVYKLVISRTECWRCALINSSIFCFPALPSPLWAWASDGCIYSYLALSEGKRIFSECFLCARLISGWHKAPGNPISSCEVAFHPPSSSLSIFSPPFCFLFLLLFFFLPPVREASCFEGN